MHYIILLKAYHFAQKIHLTWALAFDINNFKLKQTLFFYHQYIKMKLKIYIDFTFFSSTY